MGSPKSIKMIAGWFNAIEIPDELVVLTNLLGSSSDILQRVDAYRKSGVTTLRV